MGGGEKIPKIFESEEEGLKYKILRSKNVSKGKPTKLKFIGTNCIGCTHLIVLFAKNIIRLSKIENS